MITLSIDSEIFSSIVLSEEGVIYSGSCYETFNSEICRALYFNLTHVGGLFLLDVDLQTIDIF